MSWNIYALGSATTAANLADLAVNRLSALGYAANYSNVDNYNATLTVTIGGVDISGGLTVGNTSSFPAYLAVNAETNEIVIAKYNASMSLTVSTNLCWIFCYGLLHGTNASTGETGLFTMANTEVKLSDFSNAWKPTGSSDTIMLHRAMFNPYQHNNVTAFATDLFWGSVSLAPGTMITVGTDSFVCLNCTLYAKL